MILQFKVDESTVQAAWLKSLYELIEELNCRCNTYLDEKFNNAYKNLERTRVIEVYGSETMVSWLKLRMERYLHFVDSYNSKPEIQTFKDPD